jgi:hypothetical protein
MNDFLQNLRNGNNKRFDNNRKPYNGYNNNRGNERAKGNASLQRTFTKEYWPALKQILDDMASQQKRAADAGERRAQAEERKADALENIAKYVIGLIAPQAATGVETAPDLTAAPSEAVADTTDAPETPAGPAPRAGQENVPGTIHEMRQDKISYAKIAAHLASEGIPTPSGKGQWRAQMVSRIYQQNS